MKAKTLNLLLKGLLLLLLVCAAGFMALRTDMRELIQAAVEYIRTLGFWGFFVYLLLFIAAPLLLFPFAVIALAGGVLFGFGGGFAAISAACTISALLSFLLGRYFFREAVHGLVNRNARYKAIDDAVKKEGWRIVAVTRILPLFPFGPLNMFFGSTRIHFRDFLLATWAFMLPGCILHAYLGSLGRQIILSGEIERTGAEWLFLGFTSIALIGGVFYTTRLARRMLKSAASINIP